MKTVLNDVCLFFVCLFVSDDAPGHGGLSDLEVVYFCLFLSFFVYLFLCLFFLSVFLMVHLAMVDYQIRDFIYL